MVAMTTKVDDINNNRNDPNRRGEPIPVIRVHNNNHTIDDSSPEKEVVGTEEGEGRGNHHNYRVKVDIPLFYGTMGVEEFLDWEIDVDRFFDIMDVPESKQVKMVANKLKSTAAVWWDRLVVQRRRQRKNPIRMKQLMLERFNSRSRLSLSLLVSIGNLERKQFLSPRMYKTPVKGGYEEDMKEQMSKDLGDGGKLSHDTDIGKTKVYLREGQMTELDACPAEVFREICNHYLKKISQIQLSETT